MTALSSAETTSRLIDYLVDRELQGTYFDNQLLV